MDYAPPFRISNRIVSRVAQISEKLGRLAAMPSATPAPTLRRENRIRTIHSSLAIEANTLSIDQVTAVIEGRAVAAPARDLLELRYALTTYEQISTFDIGIYILIQG